MVPNKEIYKIVCQKPIVEKLWLKQLTWVGHALRRPDNEPAKVFALYEPEPSLGKNKRGRKTKSYFDYISELLLPKRSNVTNAEIMNLASDRKNWKKHVAECCKTFD